MSSEVMDRVLKGAEWLDDTYPGWWDSIDLFELNMTSGHNCVLGQVFARHLRDKQAETVDMAVRQVLSHGYSGLSGEELRRRWAHHGGYSILVSLHDVPALGMVHGFVNLGRAADLEVLTEMWIQQIISRRLMNADLDEMIRPSKVAA